MLLARIQTSFAVHFSTESECLGESSSQVTQAFEWRLTEYCLKLTKEDPLAGLLTTYSRWSNLWGLFCFDLLWKRFQIYTMPQSTSNPGSFRPNFIMWTEASLLANSFIKHCRSTPIQIQTSIYPHLIPMRSITQTFTLFNLFRKAFPIGFKLVTIYLQT